MMRLSIMIVSVLYFTCSVKFLEGGVGPLKGYGSLMLTGGPATFKNWDVEPAKSEFHC